MTDALLSRDEGAIRYLTLNRPSKLNALNTELSTRLLDALLQANDAENVAVVVLNGAGTSFCAGADIKEFSVFSGDGRQAAEKRSDLTKQLHLAFGRITKPVIAAVHGYAMGGGCGLAIAADLTIADATAKFAYPEIKRGVLPAIVLPNLVRQIGRKAAFEMVILGETRTAEEAQALGLVNRVVPEGQLDQVVAELAGRIAASGREAVFETKRLFHDVTEGSFANAMELGRQANVRMRDFEQDGAQS